MAKKKKIWNEPIDKHVDWNGDQSTGNLPVSGEMVQKFIRDTMESKIGTMYYDPTSNRYLVFSDEENRDLYLSDPEEYKTLVLSSFDAPFNYSATIYLIDTETTNYIDSTQKGVYIKAQFDTTNKEGQSVGESVTVNIKIKAGARQFSIVRQNGYQSVFSLNMDDYLSEGTNIVTIGIQGNDTFAATTTTITYYVISLTLTDQFDMANISHDGSEYDSLKVDFTINGVGIKHLEWYIDGNKLPYDSLDDISVNELSRTKYISLFNTAPGRHNLQYRAYVETSDGQKFYSDTIFHDFVVTGGEDKVVLTSFRSPAANGIIDAFTQPIPFYGLEQYKTKSIEYAIYDPFAAANNVLVINFDGQLSNYNVLNGYSYTRELKPYNSGQGTLVLSCDDASLSFNAVISKSTLELEPVTLDLDYDFEGNSRNNASADRDVYVSNGHAATFTGFKWNEGSGWTGDGLMIDEHSRLDIDYAPLAENATEGGLTIEIEFEAKRVADDNAVICSIRNEGVGLLMTASEASLTSSGGVNVSTKYKSGEPTRVTFIVNRSTLVTNKALVFICVNGILAGAVPYVLGDNFVSTSTMSFVGSSDAGILLRQIRVYKRALSLREVENNYILYRPTVEELLNAYDHNNIFEPNSETLSLEKLSAQTPIIVITGDMEALQNATDKGTEVLMDRLEVINMEDPTRNMVLTDLIMRPQGTSSMSYPKKNFRFYTQRGADTKMYDYKGNLVPERLYSFKEGAQPVKTWCLKADYAESSSTHNTGVARLWNDVMKNIRIENIDQRYYRNNTIFPGRTEAQQCAVNNNYEYDVRTTVDGFPIVLFYHRYENDPLIFLGKYNWNNDKSTESVFGFKSIPGFDNSHMECWEMLDSGLDISLFKTVSNWDEWTTDTSGKRIKMWQRTFEARYPDDGGKPSEQERGGHALKDVVRWVASTKGASKVQDGKMVVDNQAKMNDFSTNKWNHFDVYKLAAYYIYLMRFGGVDQVAKNAMFTTEDGIHWYFINYDNDTILGVRNDGLLKFGYDIDRQSKDPSDPNSYCYAAHDSVLWNNLEADEDFMNIVRVVDGALYSAGLTYKNTIDMFNNKQSAKWSERLHNLDYQFKYLDVWNDSNNNQLEKLQGARTSHRKWWLSHRFAKFDAINLCGGYTSNYIEIKTPSSGDTGQTVRITPSASGQIYGYAFKMRATVETGVVGTKDVPISFTTPDYYGLQIGSPLDYYNAAYIKVFDASPMANNIQEMFFDSINSDAQESALEEVILGNENIPNVICTQLGSISYVKYMKKLDIRNFRNVSSLDLSYNNYLEELDARNCASLTGIIFPVGAPITKLRLPESLQTLTLRNLASINTFFVEGYGKNINTISVLGCPTCDICTSFEFLRNWKAHRNSTIPASITLDNVHWTFADPTELLDFIHYIDDGGGTWSLRGDATLLSIDEEGINAIFEVFGENAFRTNADFRINSTGVFVVGPREVVSGDRVQYRLLNLSGLEGQVIYQLALDAPGVRINRDIGLLTTTENTSNDANIIVRGSLITLDTQILTSDLPVVVKKAIYPQNVIIHGESVISQDDQEYTWTTTTQGINTEFYAEWSIDGEIVDYISIKEQTTERCVLRLDAMTIVAPGTLTLSLKKVLNDEVVATFTKNIVVQNDKIAFTEVSDPYMNAVMHSHGFSYHPDYVEKYECALLTAPDLMINANRSIFIDTPGYENQRTIDLRYFYGVSYIPSNCFCDTTSSSGYKYMFANLKELILPFSCLTLKTDCMGRLSNYYYSDNSTRGLRSITCMSDYIIIEPNGLMLDSSAGNIDINVPVICKGYTSGSTSNGSICMYHRYPCTLNFSKVSTTNNGAILYSYDYTSSLHYNELITLNIESQDLIESLGSCFHSNMKTKFIFNEQFTKDCTCTYTGSNVTYEFGPNITDMHFVRSVSGNVICHGNVSSYFYSMNSLTSLFMPYSTTLYSTQLGTPPNPTTVKHYLLEDYKSAYPRYGNRFTDGFVPDGDELDWRIRTDDCVGQATSNIVYFEKFYHGTYADDTEGYEWLLEDVEYTPEMEPNTTNQPIEYRYSKTYKGQTKTAIFEQNVIENRFIKLKVRSTSSSAAILSRSLYYNEFPYGLYINNRKEIIKYERSVSAGDIILYVFSTSTLPANLLTSCANFDLVEIGSGITRINGGVISTNIYLQSNSIIPSTLTILGGSITFNSSTSISEYTLDISHLTTGAIITLPSISKLYLSVPKTTSDRNIRIRTNGNISEIILSGYVAERMFDEYNNGSYSSNVVITKVTLTEGTTIPQYAFYYGRVGTVVLPNTITSISKNALYRACVHTVDCTNVTSLSVGEYAFYASRLTNIDFTKIKSISTYSFYSCTNLSGDVVKISNTITSIPTYCFDYCSNIETVTFHNGITSIGQSAFAGCSKLKNTSDSATWFNLPSSLTNLGDGAFYGCSSMLNVLIPNTLTTLNNYVFSGCSKLNNVTIPTSVTKLGYEVFRGCSSFTSIIIPDSVGSMSSGVLYGCTNLINVQLPASLTSLPDSLLSGCTSLATVILPTGLTSISSNLFYGCTGLTSITIPENVTRIYSRAFQNCTSLTSITIPSKVTYIDQYVLSGCTSLKKIIATSNTAPSVSDYTFSGVPENGVLKIPLNTNYNNWMSPNGYYLGYYNWSCEENVPAVYYYIDQRTVQDCDMMISGNYDAETDELLGSSASVCDASTNAIKWIVDNIHLYVGCTNGNKMELKQLNDANRSVFYDGYSAADYINGSYDSIYYIYDTWLKFKGNIYVKTESAVPPGGSVVNDDYIKVTISVNRPADYISDENTGGWFKFDSNWLIGVYKASEKTVNEWTKLRSLSGASPKVNISYEDAKDESRHRMGERDKIVGRLVTYDVHKLIAYLFYGYYSTTNSQGVLGSGNNSSRVTGGTNSLGKASTNSETGTDYTSCFGLEDWFGNKSEWIDDVVSRENDSSNTSIDFYDYDSSTVIRSIDMPALNASGCPSKMLFGNDCDLIYKAFGASQDQTGYADMFVLAPDKVAVRSYYSNSPDAGVSYMAFVDSSGGANYSARMMIEGNVKDVRIVSEFSNN